MPNTHSTEIFVTPTAMDNCHGRTVLDLLMDYWIISNFISTGKRKMFYLVINYMGHYIHLLIKPVLNARPRSCLEVHVQLTKTGGVTVNHLKLIR